MKRKMPIEQRKIFGIGESVIGVIAIASLVMLVILTCLLLKRKYQQVFILSVFSVIVIALGIMFDVYVSGQTGAVVMYMLETVFLMWTITLNIISILKR